ncbi:MAG: DUF2062 domain-containing protein [Polyangiales bacterium]
MIQSWQKRCRALLVTHVLGLEDTAHRIAWGVALGFWIAWTPTFGLQIMLYLALATLLRANKVSGIPMLFLSNPLTLLPLYYFAWRVGVTLLHGLHTSESAGSAQWQEVAAVVQAATSQAAGWLRAAFWRRLGSALLGVGGELWVGSLVVGGVNAVLGYVLTYWGVLSYRKRLGKGPIRQR